MKNWRDAVVTSDTPISRVVGLMDSLGFDSLFVLDGKDQLHGLVTDIDIREAILAAVDFSSPIDRILSVRYGAAVKPDLSLAGRHGTLVLDGQGRVTSVNFPDTEKFDTVDNSVVLMAGGPGERLRPLTDRCPKPLLEVKGYPILQKTLENLIQYGFRHFYLTIHYKAQMIKDFFGDGSRWNVDIEYLEEKNRLGTAGGLSLISKAPKQPMIVVNGDVLTTVNFRQLLAFHNRLDVQATMCVQRYDVQIPYGVVEVDGARLISHREKPSQRFLVNAGMYVIAPSVLPLIPSDTYFDMPDLIQNMLDANLATAVFPMREDWIDIGHLESYKRAQETT